MFDVPAEIPMLTVLGDDVEILFGCKDLVELHDVWMFEFAEDFDL